MCSNPKCNPTNPQTTTIRPRALFSSLFVFLSLSGGRFLAPLLQDAGLTDSQIGICFALQSITSSLCATRSGAFADSYERKNPGKGRAMVLAGGILVSAVAFSLEALPLAVPFLASVYWHVAMRCLYAGAQSFIFPVLDGLTLDYLNKHSDKADYGKERLYGAIWWAITNLVMGPSLDHFGFSILYPYALVAAVVVLETIYLFVSSNNQKTIQDARSDNTAEVPHDSTHQQRPKPSNGSNNNLPAWQLVRIVCSTGFAVAFMVSVFLLAIGMSVVESLIFLYFEVLGSSYTLCSWTVLLTVVFEIPIFQVAPRLLKKHGTTKLLLTACLCYITRVVGYSMVPDGHPWMVLLWEPLHGITYACANLSAVEFVAQLVPSGYEASGQGLLSAFKGCGGILGLLLGGVGQDILGPRTLYRLLAAIVTTGFVLLTTAAVLGNHYPTSNATQSTAGEAKPLLESNPPQEQAVESA